MVKTKTYIQPGDNSNDANYNIQLVYRPADGKRGFDHFDDKRDALGRDPRAKDDHDGSEYEDDRRDSEHEHVSQRMEQRPPGATRAKFSERLNVWGNEGRGLTEVS